MDFNGVTDIMIHRRPTIDLVFIGDAHSMFNPYNHNAIHNWVDTAVTKRQTSYCVAETISTDNINYVMSTLPRYFNAENVYFCDKIRFDLVLPAHIDHPDIKYEIKKMYTSSSKLQPPTLNLPSYQLKKNVNVIPSTTSIPYFIEAAEELETIYSLSKANVQQIINNYKYLYRTKSFTPGLLSVIKQNDITLFCKYEMFAVNYMYRNFIYRVVKWINRVFKDNSPNLWEMVNGMYQDAHSINLNDGIAMALVPMLDFIMILRILDLYENFLGSSTASSISIHSKLLIWVPAGNAHTRPIATFIKQLLDKYEKTTVPLDTYYTSNEIAALVDKNLGFTNPISLYSVSHAFTVVDKAQAVTELLNLLSLNYPLSTPYLNAIKTVLDNRIFDVSHIKKIGDLIINRQILDQYTTSEIADVFAIKSNILITSGLIMESQYRRQDTYSTVNEKYVCFSYVFLNIYLPSFSLEEQSKITVYDMEDCITDPKSVLFAKLKPNVDMLTIEDNETANRLKTASCATKFCHRVKQIYEWVNAAIRPYITKEPVTSEILYQTWLKKLEAINDSNVRNKKIMILTNAYNVYKHDVKQFDEQAASICVGVSGGGSDENNGVIDEQAYLTKKTNINPIFIQSFKSLIPLILCAVLICILLYLVYILRPRSNNTKLYHPVKCHVGSY